MAGVILMYHRVAELSPDIHHLAVSRELFASHLEALLACFRPVTLDEVTHCDRGFAVTLDDGTLDSFAAAEILDRLSVPATFFVNTAQLDEHHESWWDTLERIFFDDGLGSKPLPDELRFEELRLPTATAEERLAAHQVLAPRLRHAASPMKLLAGIVAWSGLALPPRASHRCLTADEIRALAVRHAVGAHGVDHLWLPSLPAAAQGRELAACRETLRDLLGAAPSALAYPYGGCDAASLALARDLGFARAVTTEARAVVSGDDPLRLPRLDARGRSAGEVLAEVQRLLT